MKGILRDITEASVEWLSTRAELRDAGITILARSTGSILDAVESEISKLGLYVFVWPVRPLKVWQNGPGLHFDEFAWRAEVGESITTNATGLTAEYAAELVALHMLAWEPTLCGTFYVADDVIDPADYTDINAYAVNLRASGGVPQLP